MRAFLKKVLIILPIISFSECKKEVLPTVPYFNIAFVTAAGIKCYATISDEGGASITERGFMWKTEQETDYKNNKTGFENELNYFETIILGVSPGTTYLVKAYATNLEGTGYSAEKEITTPGAGTFTDSRDDKTYKWVEIGKLIWMAENLAYLPYVSSFTSDTGIFVYDYEGSSLDAAKNQEEYRTYGCLYSWEISLQICPDGWRLPSYDDWRDLESSLGFAHWTTNQGGAYLKEVGKSHWLYNTVANNCTLFSALPAGYHRHEWDHYYLDTYFHDLGRCTGFWSSSLIPEPMVVKLNDHPCFYIESVSGNDGYSVRCVKDN